MDKRIYFFSEEAPSGHAGRAFVFHGYGKQLATYQGMAVFAKKDFPDLEDREIDCGEVTHSPYMKGFAVISFLVKCKQPPEGWTGHEHGKQDFYW
jgi:hypothetical protein